MAKPRAHTHSAQFRFYAELNDLLPADRRQKTFSHHFGGRPSVKDAIESLGVPHVEVDLILVNGASVGFDHHLAHGDRVSVYPVFESLDISPIVCLRAEPLRRTAFVLDVPRSCTPIVDGQLTAEIAPLVRGGAA